jgi:AcrR family transcriptional regulator
LSRAERRSQFLDVAGAMIVEGGFEAVTMEGVAARAGVSKGLGYAYFDNREELMAAVFDREVGDLDRAVLGAVREVAAAGGSFRDQLQAALDASLDRVAERGELLGALLSERKGDGALADRRRTRQRGVETYFADLVVAEYRLEPGTALLAVNMVLGAYLAALELWGRQNVSRREIAATFTRFTAGALAALGVVREPDWSR